VENHNKIIWQLRDTIQHTEINNKIQYIWHWYMLGLAGTSGTKAGQRFAWYSVLFLCWKCFTESTCIFHVRQHNIYIDVCVSAFVTISGPVIIIMSSVCKIVTIYIYASTKIAHYCNSSFVVCELFQCNNY
jgi:hypothetical protein